MRRSLRTRLTILFLVIAILPLLIVAIFGIQQIIASQQESSIELQDEIAQRVANSVTDYIQSAERELRVLIEVRNITSLSPDVLKTIFNNMLSFSNVYNELTLVDPTGEEKVRVSRDIFSESIQLKNLAGQPEFEQPRATGGTYYSDVTFDPTTNEPFMLVSIPIINLSSGETTAVLIAKLKFKTVWNLMTEASTQDLSVFMVDQSNKVVAHTNPSIVLQGNQYQKPEKGVIGTGLVNNSAVLGVAPVNLSQNKVFYVVTEIPTSVALEASTQFFTTSIIIILVTIIAISAFSLWQTRQFTRPIELLANTARAIETGDLNARVQIETEDEIGALASTFNQMTSQLQGVLQGLEQRVAERTQELENQTRELEVATRKTLSRAEQLQTIADISRSIATVRDLDLLLPSIAKTISERFEHYHVGIFLIDENNNYAVLRATNSEGGQRMLKRGHRLKVGETGLVGTATKSGKSSIALDTGKDSVYFNNPDLPNTRSEIALPLSIGGKIIGALDVQSVEPEAFDEEDIGLLGILADQVAIAIENARLFRSTEEALEQSEETYRQFVRQEWGRLIRSYQENLGYSLSSSGISALDLASEAPAEAQQVITTGQSYFDEKQGRTVIPILLRGQVLGTLDVSARQRSLTTDEIDIAQAIAERVAFSADNARLLLESQRRAAKQQTISQITSRIGASIDLRSLLQTAVEELGRNIPGSDIVVQLQDIDEND